MLTMPLESIFVILVLRVEEELVDYVAFIVTFVVFEVELAFETTISRLN